MSLAISKMVLLTIMSLALLPVFGVHGKGFAEPSAPAAGTLDMDNAGKTYPGSNSIQPAKSSLNPTAEQIAKEPAKYSLASAFGTSSLQATPGGEAKGMIYFYNVDGNRTTYITLEVIQKPQNWEVKVNPPLHNTEVKFGGEIITVAENLRAEPTKLLSEEIEDVPEGIVCLRLPNRGYAVAKVATITICVPQSEKVSTEGDVKIMAVANWLGQDGAVTIGQTRDFDFTVKVNAW